jgi:hypothetical protein
LAPKKKKKFEMVEPKSTRSLRYNLTAVLIEAERMTMYLQFVVAALFLAVGAAFLVRGSARIPASTVGSKSVAPHSTAVLARTCEHCTAVSKTSLQMAGGSGGAGGCSVCGGATVMNCGACKGTGKDKVNGNPMERWTCKKCKGFSMIPCSKCSTSKGLTPEQTGER